MNRTDLCDSKEARWRLRTELLIKALKTRLSGLNTIFLSFFLSFLSHAQTFWQQTLLFFFHHLDYYNHKGALPAVDLYFWRRHRMQQQTPPGGGCWFMLMEVSVNQQHFSPRTSPSVHSKMCCYHRPLLLLLRFHR